MSDHVVAKFGGTSVARYPSEIKSIVESKDENRQFVVVSAPGTTESDPTKVTDILLGLAGGDITFSDALPRLLTKYRSIDIPIDEDLIETTLRSAYERVADLKEDQIQAELAHLGEYFSGLFYAQYLGATFLDPKELFVLTNDGDVTNANLDHSATEKVWQETGPKLTDRCYVVPGFYGRTTEGDAALFSRGGSDLTGAYIAYFTNAKRYENFTDSPILSADPRLVDSPKAIEVITYKELRDLTYSGFNILHQDVVKPLAERNIEIEIRGTATYPEPGTLVVEDRDPEEAILGVTFTDGYVPIKIYMPGLHEIDFALMEILTMLKELDVPVEHLSTAIDEIAVVVDKKRWHSDSLQKLEQLAQKRFGSKLEVASYERFNLGLLTVVGFGLRHRIGISGEIQKTLAEAGINIYAINQSITERNIMYSIESEKAKQALQSIYDKFIA